MSRLTRRCVEKPYATRLYGAIGKPCNDMDYLEKVYNKLGRLEDLLQSYNVKDLEELDKLLEMATAYEELTNQLGCPLEAREKALQQGYIYNGFTKLLYICCRYDENGCYLTNGAVKFYVSEYKKTWWLKEDKSE